MGIIKISLFMSLGTLTLTLVECKLTRDVKTMRKMDPYCSLTMREQEWRSATCECGSKKPKWENAVEIPKEEHESEMELAQKFMSELAQKKKFLEEEYESVQAQIDSTAEAVAEIEAEFVLCDCEAKYDEDVAAAHAKNDRMLARIEKNKEVGEAAKDEYEAKCAAKMEEAVAWRDSKLAEFEESDAKADEDKERKLARIAEMQDNEEEEHAKELEQLAASIEETKAADQERYDGVAEEIKAVAEELLEINEKMQDYLTKMCEL